MHGEMEKTVHNCWLSSYTEVGGYPRVTPHPAEFVGPGSQYEGCFGDVSDHNTPEAVAGYIRDLLAGEDFWDAYFINEPEGV